jgi:hypothetical protein
MSGRAVYIRLEAAKALGVVFLSVLLPNKRSECEQCTNSRILLGRGSCAHYGRDHKSPLTIRLDLPIRQLRRWGPIRNQASEPVATAPLSAAMTRSSQDILPILLLGVCATAAAPEFDLSAGAIVSVLAAVTTVAAADGASLASAPLRWRPDRCRWHRSVRPPAWHHHRSQVRSAVPLPAAPHLGCFLWPRA